MDRAYSVTTRATSVLLMLVGLAMVIYTFAQGGGIGALGVIVGVAFALLGAGRLYLAIAGRRDQ